ncbi:hypothetical protein OHB26_22015 [Nocardia sp. NBC_01503]|uniref:hypothetical protein n=1 Tax=Nocardia sp. NBC_01503 TaxID=2975997 RepID=UPI002E7C360B|nr:hypothetical protein [Nocardia sp. NBC_01503]WTL29657.1 hypothetical protein OHB26_22015 [Nocardia sp. NBC_01503]
MSTPEIRIFAPSEEGAGAPSRTDASAAESEYKTFVPTVGAWVQGPRMDTVDRDALIRKHFEEWAAAIAVGEMAKRARLDLIAKLRATVPEYYTQERLADLSGMTQQNISYHLSKE